VFSGRDRNWCSLTTDRFTKSMGQWCAATKLAGCSIIVGTVLRHQYGRGRQRSARRRNFTGAFAQIRKDYDALHANFKTSADASRGILTIGALTAKRRSDSG
jgi:hypothetical protein